MFSTIHKFYRNLLGSHLVPDQIFYTGGIGQSSFVQAGPEQFALFWLQHLTWIIVIFYTTFKCNKTSYMHIRDLKKKDA